MSKKNSPQLLNNFDLQKLAQDPKNKVYQYEYDTPTTRFTVQQQKQHINDIRSEFIRLHHLHQDWTDDQIRQEIKNQHTSWKSFSENLNKIFELITNRNTPNEHINHIKYMLYLKEQQNSGNISEATAQETIQNYLISQFKTGMTLEQYKRQRQHRRQSLLSSTTTPSSSSITTPPPPQPQQEKKS
jgi:hypothetical protein